MAERVMCEQKSKLSFTGVYRVLQQEATADAALVRYCFMVLK